MFSIRCYNEFLIILYCTSKQQQQVETNSSWSFFPSSASSIILLSPSYRSALQKARSCHASSLLKQKKKHYRHHIERHSKMSVDLSKGQKWPKNNTGCSDRYTNVHLIISFHDKSAPLETNKFRQPCPQVLQCHTIIL